MYEKIRDKNGKWVATRTTDFLGNPVIKNPNGKTIALKTKDFLGNTVIRDANGKVTAVKSVNLLGSPVLTSPSGKIVRTLPRKPYNRGASRGFPSPRTPNYGPSFTGARAPRLAPGRPMIQSAGRRVLTAQAKAQRDFQYLLYALCLVAYVLPTGYVAGTFFVRSLPNSYRLMTTSLTGGLFLSHLMAHRRYAPGDRP